MASIEPNDTKIRELWNWFANVSDKLANDLEDQELLDQLDEKVSKLGEIAWELGPGEKRECALTLTPDGDPDWLPMTQRAVAMAPELARWEFYPARQKKRWELQFSMEAGNGRILDVDARSWRYVLLRFPEGTFDIVLEQPNLADVDEDDRYAAAVIVLDGVLGEANRLLSIEGIEPTEVLPPEQSKKANSIKVLNDHLRSLHP